MSHNIYEVNDVVEVTRGNDKPNHIGHILSYDENISGDWEYKIQFMDGSIRTLYEDVLKRVLDDDYDEVLYENIQNNLPAWNSDILQYTISHVIDNHTLNGRIGDLLADHKGTIKIHFRSITESDFTRLKKSIITKSRNYHALTPEEGKIVDLVNQLDKKDHWPISMNMDQIYQATKQAYEYAAKISRRQFPYDKKQPTILSKKGRVKYQGVASNGLVIHFWFNFDAMRIETAYPILKNPGTIRLDKL